MYEPAHSIFGKLKISDMLDLSEGKVRLNVNIVTTQTKTFTIANCGKIWLASYAGASTFTLPAAAQAQAGRFLIIGQTVDQDLTIAAAAIDTLLTDGDLAADSVVFSTGSHKIGALALILGIGGQWAAYNLSTGCTMTVNT